ncbi:probable E3 SUMO-protein ligase RNF212 isoform X9 [Odocoileus virginianus]|uniref:Probable E3 SUMO-protein ligase RNF212 isoform X9 n=1 Tax=Odocoileus virginianus TaxID=9874 RepID=A0ABM4HSZ6_ODOVR
MCCSQTVTRPKDMRLSSGPVLPLSWAPGWHGRGQLLLGLCGDPGLAAVRHGLQTLYLRISRKAQEETVSLLRRKGLSVGGVSQEVDAAGGAAAEGEVTTSSFQHSKNSSFHGLCFLVTAPSARPNGPLFQSRDSSASERVESMEVDLTPSPRRKPEVIAGPPRISLLSPPRDGRMEMLTVLEAGGLKPSSQASAPASYLPELRACRRSLLPDPSTVSLWGSLASSELSWFLATFEQRCLHLRAASPTALSTLA